MSRGSLSLEATGSVCFIPGGVITCEFTAARLLPAIRGGEFSCISTSSLIAYFEGAIVNGKLDESALMDDEVCSNDGVAVL